MPSALARSVAGSRRILSLKISNQDPCPPSWRIAILRRSRQKGLPGKSTVVPPVPVTDKVYVFVVVSAGVGYELPLTADAVISALPTPADPMTAVPPAKVGVRVMEEL